MSDILKFSERAKAIYADEQQLQKELYAFLKGRLIKVTDPNFNGQPLGSSWKKLMGEVFTIDHAMVSDGKLYVWFDGAKHYTYMPLNYGELLPVVKDSLTTEIHMENSRKAQ